MAEQQQEYRKKYNKELPLDDFAVWGQVLDYGVRTVMKYSLAGVGDRTLLDGRALFSNFEFFILILPHSKPALHFLPHQSCIRLPSTSRGSIRPSSVWKRSTENLTN